MIIATIFVSGGHHAKDSGAVSKDGKTTEFKYCASFRDMVVAEIKAIRPDIKVITDQDYETLSQYLTRIKTGSGSVVIEPHLNSAANKSATGTEVLIADNHTKNSALMAAEMSQAIANAFGLKNRGVKTESQSARGKLALVRKDGTTVLPELGFISNEQVDLVFLNDPCKKAAAAKAVAMIAIKYEDLIK